MLPPGSCHSLLSYHSDMVVNPVTLSFQESQKLASRAGPSAQGPELLPPGFEAISSSADLGKGTAHAKMPVCREVGLLLNPYVLFFKSRLSKSMFELQLLDKFQSNVFSFSSKGYSIFLGPLTTTNTDTSQFSETVFV